MESNQSAANPAISVSLPHTSAVHGANISIPITSGDLSSQNVISYDLDLVFDPNVLQPQSSRADSSGTLSSSLTLTVNSNIPGHLRVAGFGTAPLIGSGTLLNLNFTVVGAAGLTTTLAAQSFEFNEGNPAVTTTNGQFTVATPTESSGTISGTIDDNSGNPVAGVAMRLNGTQNRLTITDAGGNYHFDNVETNGVYTVTPSRANFMFSPSQRSFSQIGQHTDATFTASLANGGLSPLDTTEYFVRQQYLDFLDREPDESGLIFWINNIESCGADANCREVKRIDTSAAFFLSIEFQQTGYLVERTYLVAYGHMANAPVPINLSEFRPDTAEISKGVVVLQSGWEAKLENNKQAFTAEFVKRSRFTATYAATLSPSEFVDKLFMNAGVIPANTDRMTAINEFGSTNTSADVAARGRALRRVAENSVLTQQEFNRAFVLMQYFGYLRRNPNDPQDTDYIGYNFWLTKLNLFNGNYANAEMVKAFIVSSEYRQRFGL